MRWSRSPHPPSRAEKHPPRFAAPRSICSNDVYLHTDETLMPRLKKAWSSWNFLGASSGATAGDDAAVCVTYWLNKLQVCAAARGGRRAQCSACAARSESLRHVVSSLTCAARPVPHPQRRLRTSPPAPDTPAPPAPRPLPPHPSFRAAEPAAQRAPDVCDAQPPEAAGRGHGHQAARPGAPGVQLRVLPGAGARAQHPGHRRRLLCRCAAGLARSAGSPGRGRRPCQLASLPAARGALQPGVTRPFRPLRHPLRCVVRLRLPRGRHQGRHRRGHAAGCQGAPQACSCAQRPAFARNPCLHFYATHSAL